MTRIRNGRLRAAREATPSQRIPGATLSRAELAEQVNEWLDQHTGRRGALDANYLAKLERGAVRCPGEGYRAGFRAVLGAASDAELGFLTDMGRSAARSPVPAVPRFNSDVTARERPADAGYIFEVRETLSHLVALDGAHGGAEIAPLALRCFRRAQRILLDGNYVSAVERDLEATTAELGELAGWLLFDAERQDEARAVNAEAFTLAHLAGDSSMQWFILTNQALASMHTGHHRDALRISQRMSDRDELPGRVRALFDVRAARALAVLGDDGSALRMFDRARSAFSDGTARQDPAWSWWFDEGELAAHQGLLHASLGDFTNALPLLVTAEQRSLQQEHFRWALYIHRANLLRACLQAGTWSETERVAVDIAPMVGEIASARTEGIVRQALALRRRHTGLPSTLTDVLDHIDSQLPGSRGR